MLYSKRNRFKPTFKQFLRLRENVQNKKKLFKFQDKKKWKTLIKHYKKRLRKYKKYVPIDQTKYLITKFPSRGTSYKKRYRDTLQSIKKLNLSYGGLLKKYFKTHVKKTKQTKISSMRKKTSLTLLQLLESRLDTVLYRSNFAFSIRAARQLIAHGKIFVNNCQVKNKNYILKTGDLISACNDSIFSIQKNNWQKIESKSLWPIPQDHLHISYKTLEIIFGDIDIKTLTISFSFYLHLEKIMLNSRYQ